MKKALIIGGGMAGCSFSHLLSLQNGWDITLVEKNNFLGAGVRTSWYGGHPHTYGPRHFLTESKNIYDYFNKYCPLRDCSEHEFWTYIEKDKAFYNFPINKKDIPKMPDKDKINYELKNAKMASSNIRFDPAGKIMEGQESLAATNLEDFWIESVGKTLYEKFVKYYTQKMWMVDDNRLIDDFGWSPKGVTLEEGGREGWSYAMSGYPIAENGYNNYFDLATENARVMLNTTIDEYDILNKTVLLNGEKKTYDVIVNTISPDIIMNFEYGELGYIGRDMLKIILPIKRLFPSNVYFLYYAGQEKYNRIVEYKKLTRVKWDEPSTLITIEFTSKNGRHYPLPYKSEKSRAKMYFDDMPDNVFSIGRAGSYDYGVDMDDAIEQSMGIMKKI